MMESWNPLSWTAPTLAEQANLDHGTTRSRTAFTEDRRSLGQVTRRDAPVTNDHEQNDEHGIPSHIRGHSVMEGAGPGGR